MAAVDQFSGSVPAIDAPYTGAVAVTPNDGVDLANVSRAIYVGGAGALTVTMLNGVDVTFAAVPAGTTIRIRVTRVKSTGTAATSIVALV